MANTGTASARRARLRSSGNSARQHVEVALLAGIAGPPRINIPLGRSFRAAPIDRWYPWRTSRQRAPLAFCIGRTKRPIGRRTMRAIGLVLLSIAIMALLLTDANAKRRSSAQGSQAAGASGSWCAVHPRHG